MTIGFRPLRPKDYPLFAGWLAEPHVARWWREPATVEFVEKEYGPTDSKTAVYVILGDGRSIGIIQAYRLEDYPEHAQKIGIGQGVGMDLFIGLADLTGKGLGTQILATFIDQAIRPHYPAAECVVADPETANVASVRAFEKAGFREGAVVRGEHGPEQLMVFTL